MRYALAAILTLHVAPAGATPSTRPPNIIIVFADDLGYGDLSSYGHPTIRTPSLDRMAREGQRWTDFYAPMSVCSPSRAGLLTGRLPVRSGLYGRRSRVLFPEDRDGIPQSEVTLAEALAERGYRTAIVGKWHLGHRPEFLPTRHGFESWYGIPYSNDMMWTIEREGREHWIELMMNPRLEYWNVPLMRSVRTATGTDDEIVEQPAQQPTITSRYVAEAVEFIRRNRESPFFLYLAHTQPHMPLYRSPSSEGRSRAGVYGDVIEEIDAGMGQILEALEKEGLSQRTLVVFTSDNGPWLMFRQHGGSAGPLRDGKGTTWEGGMRVPAVFWWPGMVVPGDVAELGTALDLFTTCLRLAGASEPLDRVIDGLDLTPVLLGTGPGPRRHVYYYRDGEVYAYRQGHYKIHLITQGEYGDGQRRTEHDPPLLYNLGDDPGERFDLSSKRPEIVQELLTAVHRHQEEMVAAESIFDRRFAEESSR